MIGCQDCREGHADDGQDDAGQNGLHECRHDHAERDAANRLAREDDRILALRSDQPRPEAAHAFSHSLPGCKENGSDDDERQQVCDDDNRNEQANHRHRSSLEQDAA